MTEDKFKPNTPQSSVVQIIKASALGSDLSASSSMSNLTYQDANELTQDKLKFMREVQNLLSGHQLNNLSMIGCYHSDNSWDSRPVLANRDEFGSLLVFRILQPGIQLEPAAEAAWLKLSLTLSGTYLASGLDLLPSINTTDKTYWSIRRFYPHTLEERTDLSGFVSEQGSNRCLNIILGLLSELKKLEQHSTPHAHLRPSNIGWDEDSLYLLDPWYFSYSKQQTLTSDKSEQLGPRSLAGLLLNTFRPCLNEDCLQILFAFISSNQDGLSFGDLFDALAKLPESADNDRSSGQSFQQQSAAHPQDSHHHQHQSLIAPSGRVITPGSQSIPEDSQQAQKKPRSTATRITLNRPVSAQRLLAKTGEMSGKQAFLTRQHLFFLLIAMTVVIFILLISRSISFFPSRYDIAELEASWKSNDLSALKEIAETALVDKNPEVQAFIEADLLAGNNRPGTKVNFLKVAFNELWINDLSGKDRFFALALTLAGLYRVPNDQMPSIERLHPAILLALLGDLSLTASNNKFDNLKTEKLSKLPGSYGTVFSALNELGYLKVGNDPVRAAARLICGHSDRESIEYLLSGSKSEEESLRLLAAVAPFAEMYSDLASSIFSALVERNDILGTRSRWFIEGNLAQWNKVEVKNLVFITLGILPEKITELDKLSDLLNFPGQNVRSKAKERILQQLEDSSYNDLLDLLISSPGILSRSQIITLLATLQVPSDQAAPFVASWLQLEPDPRIVLEFLIDTRNKRAFELSSVQLANYLARKDFDISDKQLPLLLTHPEALARTLAFPRLNPENKVDRLILEQWFRSETSPRIKEEIKKKISAVEELG